MPTDLNIVEVPGDVVRTPLSMVIRDAVEGVAGVPRVLSITTLDSTHLRVTFVRPLLNNAALRCEEIYDVVTETVGARDISVRGIVLEGNPVTSILLTVDEMLNVADYRLDIQQIEEA